MTDKRWTEVLCTKCGGNGVIPIRVKMGDIGPDLDAIDRAYRRYEDAVYGPTMGDYTSDTEAYQTLKEATLHLKVQANNLLQKLRCSVIGTSICPRCDGHCYDPDRDK